MDSGGSVTGRKSITWATATAINCLVTPGRAPSAKPGRTLTSSTWFAVTTIDAIYASLTPCARTPAAGNNSEPATAMTETLMKTSLVRCANGSFGAVASYREEHEGCQPAQGEFDAR